MKVIVKLIRFNEEKAVVVKNVEGKLDLKKHQFNLEEL